MNKINFSCLYLGHVFHKRFHPFFHKFKYRVFSLYLDYNEISNLSKKIFLFSYNKFNLISFYDLDHGYRNGISIKKFITDQLIKQKINVSKLNIRILCFPRILGYVFNPLSIIYCFDKEKLISIFYEVKNTSNEQHTYIFVNNNKNDDISYTHSCEKKFYVSPFIEMKSYYEFNIRNPEKKLFILINQYLNNGKRIFIASQKGKRFKFNSSNLIKSFFFYPFLTFKIIYSIHWQAFKLWMKGGVFYKRTPKYIDTKSFEGEIIEK